MRPSTGWGPSHFTPEHLLAANQLWHWELRPYEVEALRQLDIIVMHPDALKDEDDG